MVDELVPEPEFDDDEAEGHPRPSDSVFDAFPTVQPNIIMDPSDGMPREADPPWTFEDAQAPPLTPETMVCIRQSDGLGPCKHYRRQLALDPEMDRPIILRWCTCPALRGTNGAALSLRDSAMPHCELRDPPDPRSTELLDKLDDEKIRLGQNREYFRMFKTPEDVKLGRTKV